MYKVWGDLVHFDPGGLDTFKTNRSGPWRLGIHEKINLRVSKLISRNLFQFWPLKTHFKRSTESENTHSMFPEPSFSKTMYFWIGRDTILPHLYILMNSLHVELKTCIHFFFKNTLFKGSICVYWTINNKFFNVISILKHPAMIFTHSYLDILNLRTHLILSKSVSPTLNWIQCMHIL